MLESHRRSFLQALNSRWIYGKIPLLHSIVLLFEMAAVSILVQKFNASYSSRPILTTMITNAVLGGIADTVAQVLSSMRQKAARKNSNASSQSGDFISIEIQDLEKKDSWPSGEILSSQRNGPPPFDFERLTRFMSYGFLMAPIQYAWFNFLSAAFPITKVSGTIPALKRVAFDQLIFSPLSIAGFFTFMTLAEGGGRRAIARKIEDVYMPALKANYMLWPAVQMLNFRVVPLQFQIPFVSTVGIAWTAYLSLTNASEDV